MTSEAGDRGWLQRLVHGVAYRIHRYEWRLDPRSRLVNLDEVCVDRPLFLLGTQGGGLTLISRVLRRHSDVVSATGDASYWTGSAEMQNVLAKGLPDDLRLRGHPALKRRGWQDSWTYATDELIPNFRRTASDADGRLRETFLRRLRELLVVHGGARSSHRFVDKSQCYTVKVGFLRRLLEGCDPRFLLVTRNPFALCRRAVEKVLDGMDLSRSERLDLAVQHWDNSMRCALADGEELGGFTVVRFEDFLAEPEQTLAVIDEVAEIGLEPELLPGPGDRMPLGTPPDNKWYPLRPEVNRKYLDELPPEVVEAVEERCGDLAERFGYTPEGP